MDYIEKHKRSKLSLIVNWCTDNNLYWIITNNILIISTFDTN